MGEQFMAEIKVSDAKSLLNAPFVLVFDPAFLEFQAAAEGDFLNRDGKPTTFKTTVDKTTGQVTIISARQPGDAGIGGAGTLLTASFKAKSKGPASLGFMSVKFTDVGGKIIETIPYNTVIEIK
jgi:general secretion pathway protein D